MTTPAALTSAPPELNTLKIEIDGAQIGHPHP